VKKVKQPKNALPGLKKSAAKIHSQGQARAPKVDLPSPETKKTPVKSK
jgi:hypothetical protein